MYPSFCKPSQDFCHFPLLSSNYSSRFAKDAFRSPPPLNLLFLLPFPLPLHGYISWLRVTLSDCVKASPPLSLVLPTFFPFYFHFSKTFPPSLLSFLSASFRPAINGQSPPFSKGCWRTAMLSAFSFLLQTPTSLSGITPTLPIPHVADGFKGMKMKTPFLFLFNRSSSLFFFFPVPFRHIS